MCVCMNFTISFLSLSWVQRLDRTRRDPVPIDAPDASAKRPAFEIPRSDRAFLAREQDRQLARRRPTRHDKRVGEPTQRRQVAHKLSRQLDPERERDRRQIVPRRLVPLVEDSTTVLRRRGQGADDLSTPPLDEFTVVRSLETLLDEPRDRRRQGIFFIARELLERRVARTEADERRGRTRREQGRRSPSSRITSNHSRRLPCCCLL